LNKNIAKRKILPKVRMNGFDWTFVLKILAFGELQVVMQY